MSVELESAARLNALKQGIEAKTGETYTDLTGGVNALIAGFGQGGGADDIISAFVQDEIEIIDSDTITAVPRDVLRGRKKLRKVNLPNCTVILQDSFNTSTGLEEVYFESYVKREPTDITVNIFNGCTALKKAYFPNCIELQQNMFRGCSSLSDLTMSPNLSQVQGNSLSGTAIVSFVYPACTTMYNTVFEGCKSLKLVDISLSAWKIESQLFYEATAFNTFVLRSPTVVPLTNVTAFYGTPFAVGGTGGTVYVPSALIESYKTATNWVTLYEAGTCNFVAIEGSEYE